MSDAASGIGRCRVVHLGMWIIACLILTGCVFQDVRRQQVKIDAVCLIGVQHATIAPEDALHKGTSHQQRIAQEPHLDSGVPLLLWCMLWSLSNAGMTLKWCAMCACMACKHVLKHVMRLVNLSNRPKHEM